jgi:archaellum component FlaF (FlaF/FlaG flagellin family)
VQGPPPGAQARPPGGQRPPAGTSNASAKPAQRSQPSRSAQSTQSAKARQRSQPTDSRSSSSASSQAPAADITLDDEDLKAAGGSTFSPAVVILMVVLLGVGILFGWMAANSMQNRDIYNARSEDAARIHGALEAKVAELDKAKELVGKVSKLEPNYETNEEFLAINKQLAELEIAPSGNLLGGNRLLLGPEVIDAVTNYTADARILERMLKEHQQLTVNDKEQLKELVEGNEVVKKDQFAVLFDYDHLAQKSGSEDYMPRPGKLVTVPSLEKDEDGKIEVDLLNSDRSVKTPIQGLLPLGKGDIMKSGGENALNRYQARLAKIERQTKQFEQYRKGMMTKLEALATLESAPLLNF